MTSKNKVIIFLLILSVISISSISSVFAINIYGGAFSTGGGADDLTYASLDIGRAYAGNQVIVQIWYSRDGSILNNGNLVPITITHDGFVNIRSADAYSYFPDHAKINIYDTNNVLLTSKDVNLYPDKGIQTFGTRDYDISYIH